MGALDLKDSNSNSEQVDIAQVFHCDGLLLCTTKDNKLVVWNPCLGETRWIQPKPGCQYPRHPTFFLGYQNNKSCRSYKILRCWESWNDEDECNQRDRFEIYEFSSDSWRRLHETASEYIFILVKGVSLKGNTFWIIDLEGEEENNYLLSFDFTTERFKRLSLPAFQTNDGCVMDLSVVREENLLVSHRCLNLNQMEILVTKKFDDTQAALSWTKYVTVDLLKINRNLFSLMATAVIYEEKKVVLCRSHGHWRRINMFGLDIKLEGKLVLVLNRGSDDKLQACEFSKEDYMALIKISGYAARALGSLLWPLYGMGEACSKASIGGGLRDSCGVLSYRD
ncbi:unnamed protein product [Microthlaspi erraticum]|uniref:F-box associated beta-propeller type 1 domain-containing protein n=1 Tax=Microthlaspi erraticum TaxID=1685480 RepID=A0A6D2HM08_9BRAS|nr:unnamed protein product [Microthlaspi erraticum]